MCRWLLFLRLLLLLLLSGISYGAEKRIKSVNDLITFSNDVNRGTTYSGTTILLDNDIDFAGKTAMEPIGKDSNHCFLGTFDGQGHVIKNMKVDTSTSGYVGLFGYSNGLTVKNLVFDPSCSVITSHNNSGTRYIGGILGICQMRVSSCVFSDIVNWASVTFAGNASGDLHLGGIAGVLWSFNYDASFKNCVNYGAVTHKGTVRGYCDIGGVVGHFSNGPKRIQNCVNYGSISHTGSSLNGLFIGGIVGTVMSDDKSGNAIIENCLNAGNTELSDMTKYAMGGIIGNAGANASVSIVHCFWTSNTRSKKLYGRNVSEVSVSDSHLTELNTTTMNEMNDYAAKKSGWSKWVLLRLNGGRINNLSQDILVMAKSHFPDPVKEGNAFLFWCEDLYCNVKYNTTDPSNASEVYAIWNTSTLTFDFENGTVLRKEFQFNETIEYPEDVTREGHTFDGWNPEPTKMPGADVTVVAQWVEVSINSSSSIESSSSSSSIEFSSSSSSSEKHIVANATKYVKITFDTKYMTDEEAERVIKQFTDGNDYVIKRFYGSGNEFIVEFADEKAAEEFVRSVSTASEYSKSVVKRVEFIDEHERSISSLYHPIFLISVFIL